MQPFGNAREDQRAGTIASAYINTHLKPGRKPLTWQTFYPAYGEKEVLDWQSLLTKVEAINAELGGDDIRSTKPSS